MPLIFLFDSNIRELDTKLMAKDQKVALSSWEKLSVTIAYIWTTMYLTSLVSSLVLLNVVIFSRTHNAYGH